MKMSVKKGVARLALGAMIGTGLLLANPESASACVALRGNKMANTCNYKIKLVYATSKGTCKNHYPKPRGCGKTLSPGESQPIQGSGRVVWRHCKYTDWAKNRCSLAPK